MPKAKPKLNAMELVRELVAIPGPPGLEDLVREAVARHVTSLGFTPISDPKGNLVVRVTGGGGHVATNRRRVAQLPNDPTTQRPTILVTAHLDEIALMVSEIEVDGRISVIPLGGVSPWKWGEQPVQVLARRGPIDGILSFGCIHSESPISPAEQARNSGLKWRHAFIFTGMSPRDLVRSGVRPGTRVVLHPDRRTVMEIGDHVASYFLDDRADLVAMLLAMEAIRDEPLEGDVVFAGTAAEEVGGEGAQYLMHQLQPDICVALEIGPTVPESPFAIDENPTVWVTDSYASIAARDHDLLMELGEELGMRLHWQPLSRGGSDASCSAARGLTARPVTLGFPVENSHGLEIMHRDAPAELARLAVAYLRRAGSSV